MRTFLKERLRNFSNARQGNAAMLFALGAPLMILSIAVAIDFSNASVVKTKLNAAADAAALAALTPSMMAMTDDQAKTASLAMFDARVAAIGSLIAGQTTRDAVITDPNGLGSRKIVITYSANANTLMGGVLGRNSLNVGGTSTAQASIPPNIDFYLLLDNSPSMALPATAAGITTMQTVASGGCAFACHQASTNNGDTVGNLCADKSPPPFPSCNSNGSEGSNNQYCTLPSNCSSSVQKKYSAYTNQAQADNFQMARWNNIPLRLDELSNGVTKLMQTAKNYHDNGLYAIPPTYQFAAYSMNSLWNIGVTNTRLMALTSDYINSWSSSQSNFGVLEYFSNDNGCANPACSAGSGVPDVATNYDNSLGDIKNVMPTPGNGTNQTADKPQEVLFFVTDGVEDEQTTSCTKPLSGNRCQSPINPTLCQAIKDKGIKIAVLYTEYLAVTSNGWYNSWISPFQSTIGDKLQACASTPDLYTKVTFGDDIGDALSKLFNKTVQQAALAR